MVTNVAYYDTSDCIKAVTFAVTQGSFSLNVTFQVLHFFVFMHILWWTEK
jgi:hypothetical protein